jgi:uncharacterized protein YndB with AHSA1/START domain
MTAHSVIHDTFMIERTYPASPSRVFAAFASREAKDAWGGGGDTAEVEPGTGPSEFDFRIGGHERFGVAFQSVSYTYDALYYDIVPGQRLVYSYEMYAGAARISVSVATIEFAEADSGTRVTWTEQGAYLDGFDGAEAPRLREGGTSEMLDGLAKYLA